MCTKGHFIVATLLLLLLCLGYFSYPPQRFVGDVWGGGGVLNIFAKFRNNSQRNALKHLQH